MNIKEINCFFIEDSSLSLVFEFNKKLVFLPYCVAACLSIVFPKQRILILLKEPIIFSSIE